MKNKYMIVASISISLFMGCNNEKNRKVVHPNAINSSYSCMEITSLAELESKFDSYLKEEALRICEAEYQQQTQDLYLGGKV